MKIRNGFVSNSSSSSFCVYGVCIDKERLIALFDIDMEEEDCSEDEIDDVLGLADLGLASYTNRFCVYIGCRWDSIMQNETRKQFVASVEAGIKTLVSHNPTIAKLIGTDYTCDTYHDDLDI